MRNRRFMFWRFAGIFGGISILFLAALGIVIYFAANMPHPEGPRVGIMIPMNPASNLFIFSDRMSEAMRALE